MQGREWRIVGHLDLFSNVERSLSERTLIASDSFAASAGGSRLQNAQSSNFLLCNQPIDQFFDVAKSYQA
jgi:hypothetical protein